MSPSTPGIAGPGGATRAPLTEDMMLDRLVAGIDNDEQLTLVLGSGLGASGSPRVEDVVRLAEQYAMGRGDGGDLSRALVRARQVAAETPGAASVRTAVYNEYRRVLAAWVSGGEFDVIAQQAVLECYRPADRRASPLANHGIWQRVSLSLGEHVENDVGSWQLSAGVESLGAVVVQLPERFGGRILTTNFDPLIEVSIRSANGRAASVPLAADGSSDRTAGGEGTVAVYHLHGFWRPTLFTRGAALVHDPGLLAHDRLTAATAELINGDTVCVIGSSDSFGTIVEALRAVASYRAIQVLWALHTPDVDAAAALQKELAGRIGAPVSCAAGVDADRLLARFSARLNISLTPRAGGPRHRVRHPSWERQIVSWPDAAPPAEIGHLVQQLERRFGWGYRQGEAGRPNVLFWPVKLQTRASVIHMVQAIVAGALARRGMRLVVSIDDFGAPPAESGRQAFQADLARWVRHTAPAVEIPFVSLSQFIAEQRRRSSPEDLLQSVDPWTVAVDFYGKHNPSIYSLLVATKVLPNFTLRELDENPAVIVQALLRNNANRLLTPLTMWPFLRFLLRSEPPGGVMTLGGWDEGPFWEQWRQVYGLGIGQLYNPYFPSLSHHSGLVRWSSRDELLGNLSQMQALNGWDKEGSYIPWLFQNAMLLPIYLNHEAPSEIDGSPIDSWTAFLAAIQERQPALEQLADRASSLYLGGGGT